MRTERTIGYRITAILAAAIAGGCSSLHVADATSDREIDVPATDGSDIQVDAVDACSTCQPPLPTNVTAGDWHTCALMNDGFLRCWGSNRRGQLGQPLLSVPNSDPRFDRDPHFRPERLDARVEFPADSVSAGGQHTCARRGGVSWVCWGEDAYGQLGIGDAFDGGVHWEPQPVYGAPADITQLFAGVHHTCARHADDNATCWGRNNVSQLANRETANASPFPTPVYRDSVTALDHVYEILPGFTNTCARVFAPSGNVVCWGSNDAGELGNGTTIPSPFPTPVAMDASVGEISLRENHVCAIAGDMSEVLCWGNNASGQLGSGVAGGFNPRPAPVVLVADGSMRLFGVRHLAAGRDHTCASTGNSVFCWGDNQLGQLGNGSSDASSALPVLVHLPAPAVGVVAIVSGQSHSCALLNDRRLYCWGSNEFGQLGIGSPDRMRATPTLVAF